MRAPVGNNGHGGQGGRPGTARASAENTLEGDEAQESNGSDAAVTQRTATDSADEKSLEVAVGGSHPAITGSR